MSQLLHTCLTKGLHADGDQLQRDLNWIMARRAQLKVYDDHLECGDWTIPYASFQAATLSSVKSITGGYVLKVETRDSGTYHFGLNARGFWTEQMPFEVVRDTARLTYSPLSVAIRVASLGVLGYLVWDAFGR